jgi:spore maturation protein CgeB
MGHQVEGFNPQEYPRALAAVARTERGYRLARRVLTPFFGDRWPFPASALVRKVREVNPDMILIIALYEVSPEVIQSIKRVSRAKIVGWFQDHVVNFGRHRFLLADYDALCFKDPFIVEKLRDYAGLDHVYYLPEAFEPSCCYPLEITDDDRARYGCDVATYGNVYPYRSVLLRHLSDMDFRLYGHRPPLAADDPLLKSWYGSFVFGEEKIRAVLSAKVVLNSSHFGEVRSVNARLFEVAGIGGFQVTDAPGTAEFFEPDREIAVFRGPRQMREVIEYYLQHEDERHSMARRAHERAMREHTLDRRLQRLIEFAGLGEG